MATNFKSKFAGAAPAKGGGVYFTPGSYVARVERMKAFISEMEQKPYVCLETMILSAQGSEARPANTRCDHLQSDTPKTVGFVLQMAMAVMGLDPELWATMTEEEQLAVQKTYDSYVDKDLNAARGQLVRIEVRTKRLGKNKDGKEWPTATFFPYDGPAFT